MSTDKPIMDDKVFVDWDQLLAAVKFKGQWRFFYDVDTMFLLDYPAYHAGYVPTPGGWRDGILIVSEANAERWMAALAGEVTPDQLARTYWRDTLKRVKLTFVIDFDEKLWVGQGWHNDQSPFQDYQPQGWLTDEDDVAKFLPPEIKKLWA